MAYDAFLKIDGIDGESTSSGRESWIEILSFSFGATNPVAIGTGSGGAGAGKVSVQSFSFTKKTDKSSPKLFQACCSGKHFQTAMISLRKAGGDSPVEYLKYDFTEAFVDSIQWSGSTGGDDTPTESLGFAFSSVNVTYTPQKDDGSAGSPQVAGWNVKVNAKM